MVMRWALVDSDFIVDNVIIWGGNDPLWNDLLAVQLLDGERCAPGWTYDPAPMASPRFIEPVQPQDN